MKRNLILAGITLLLLGAAVIGCIFINKSQHGTVAVISQDGQEIGRIDLSLVSEPYTITIEGDGGAENVVCVEHGGISMEYANCPDGLCMQRGTIRGGGLPIVCLPNHIVIEIIGGNASDVDIITY